MRRALIFLVLVSAVVVVVHNKQSRRCAPPETSAATNSASPKEMHKTRIAARSHSGRAAQQASNRRSIQDLLKTGLDNLPKLTAEQAELYLQANHRNAGSLLAAWQTTGETRYLHEAWEKSPHDAHVDFSVAFRADFTPEERRQALENLKQADPNNALGNYLSAAQDFKSGQQSEALQELTAGAAKSTLSDYYRDFAQNAVEAYEAAGYPATEAKMLGEGGVMLPDLAQLKSVGKDLVALSQSYQQAGDAASAQSALQMAMNLGDQVRNEPQAPLITTLVGIAMDRIALDAMDPAAPYGNSGQTVQDQINTLVQQRQNIRDLNNQAQGLWDAMSDQDFGDFYNRRTLFGELAAEQWIVTKFGQTQ